MFWNKLVLSLDPWFLPELSKVDYLPFFCSFISRGASFGHRDSFDVSDVSLGSSRVELFPRYRYCAPFSFWALSFFVFCINSLFEEW